MTDEEKELVVKLVASGKNTFKELSSVAPSEWRWNIIGHLGRGGYIDDVVRLDKKLEYMDALYYKPVENDTFHLTDTGKNLLHRLNKEDLQLRLAEKAVQLAEQSLKKSEVSNKLSIDSNEIAGSASKTSRKSLWMVV